MNLLGNYNIAKHTGETMLISWVNLETAKHYLKVYQDRYKPGSPYPNGQGFYPDFGFHIVRHGDC